MNRTAVLAVLAIVSGCGDAAPSAPSSKVDSRIAEYQDEDGVVLKLVLEDLLRYPEFRTYPLGSAGQELVVWDETEGLSAFILTGQLSSELSDQPPVSMELYNSLKSRNSRKIALHAIPLKEVRMGRERDLPKGEFRDSRAFEKAYPRARAYVSFWLPAYSEEGTTALVRFGFGPTPHGACGTYFLEKSGGSWKVLWRTLSYYA